jgi:ligand-binding SRPBCC domain-containing protein
MIITLKTKVKGNYKKVMESFDIDLFEALKPAGANMEIVEFTGSKKGDKVHLRFNNPFKIEWISIITEDGINETEAYFIDVGTTLPFPLRTWEHKHIVRKISEFESEIIDQMKYEGVNKFWTIILKPALYMAFYPRKKVYKRYFERLNK